MQDYLNGNNIQCFFIPSGINEKTLTIEYKRTKRKFDLDKKLPYQSFAYDYSEDFIIFDYENVRKNFDQSWIHIVEEGKCKFFVPTEVMNEKYPIVLVINKYGIPLKITSPPDFFVLQEDYLNLLKKIGRIKQDGLPNPEKRISLQETAFEMKWYDFKRLPKINSNIIGVALSILAVNKDYDIKDRLAKYCDKHDIDITKAIIDYVKWANLHSIDVTVEEIEEVLC